MKNIQEIKERLFQYTRELEGTQGGKAVEIRSRMSELNWVLGEEKP